MLRESADGDPASYFKGMHVVAALDAELRDATGGDQTFQSVFRRVNAYNGTVTYETFATLVETVAGESRDEWLATYVGTDALPSVPDYLDAPTPTATPAACGSQQDAGDSSVLAVLLFVAALIVGVGTFLFWRRG